MKDDLKLIVPKNFKEVGTKVNAHINELWDTDKNYIVDLKLERFRNGEGKAVLNESVRNQDVYIMPDVYNYDVTYKFHGSDHRMTPDEHMQDIKRIINAMSGHAKKITLVMPMLYQSRQDKRVLKEDLACAKFLQEIESDGVKEIVSFDVHEPRVYNSIPNLPFSNSYATGELLLSLLNKERPNVNNIFVVGPDEGAQQRARFVADLLGKDMPFANFYKRRDYSQVQNGGNPIKYHAFNGPDRLDGYDVIVPDDMIDSGGSLLKAAKSLKDRGASHIYLMTTFGLFTEGVEEFDKYYADGIIDRVYTTNLNYVPDDIKSREWYVNVDLSFKLANLITNLNQGHSIRDMLKGDKEAVEKIKKLGFYKYE